MVADYISTSIIPGSDYATPVFAVATAPTCNPPRGLTCIAGAVCLQAIFAATVPVVGGSNTVGTILSIPSTIPPIPLLIPRLARVQSQLTN
jgi:hypothetical protein